MHPLQKMKFLRWSRNLRCGNIKPIAIDSRDSFSHGLKLLPMPKFYNLLLLIITPHLIAANTTWIVKCGKNVLSKN